MAVIITSSMVLQTPAESGGTGQLPPFPLTHARIGYQTICTASNVVASSEAAGFPAEDATNIFTNEFWQPTALPATWTCDAGDGVDTDYIGIAAHTLGSANCSLTIEYSTDNSTWTELNAFLPKDNRPIMLIYETITARWWRFTLNGTTIPRIGVIYIGQALQMQRPIYGGHAPLTLNRSTTIYNQISEAGQFMARSIIRQGNSTSFAWKNLTATWYREFFDPFVLAARRTPFFIAWRPATFPEEAGFVRTGGDINPTNTGIKNYMEVSMTVYGVTDE